LKTKTNKKLKNIESNKCIAAMVHNHCLMQAALHVFCYTGMNGWGSLQTTPACGQFRCCLESKIKQADSF